MDDQNQTNQPLDQQGGVGSMPPVPDPVVPPTPSYTPPAPSYVPPVPEPILPPEKPVFTPPSIPDEPSVLPPMPKPEVSFTPPAEIPPIPSYTPPAPTYTPPAPEPVTDIVPPVTTTTTNTETVTTSQPSPAEPPMPSGKPKKKLSPIIGGVLALFLVAGVAGAAYYVSNQLSTRTAVAPNAPESNPAASAGICNSESVGGCIGVSWGSSCGSPKTCQPAPQSLTSVCQCYEVTTTTTCPASECATAGITSCWTTTNTIWECVLWGGTCPGGYYKNTGVACGGGEDTGTGSTSTTSCTKDGNYVYQIDPEKTCAYKSSGDNTSSCGTETCSPYTYSCGIYCFDTACGADACGKYPTYPTCDETKRDAPAGTSITFAKTGKVIPFAKNNTPNDVEGGSGYSGTITLSKTGATDIVIPIDKKGEAVELTSFDVTAGDVYSIKMKFTGDAKDAYGWIANQGDTCGPVKTPGDPLTDNSKATGFCGEPVNISAVKTLAASKTTLADISAGSTNASIQCWADAELGDATQDYDFEDFVLVLGYESATDEVGACMAIEIFKKVDGIYEDTALTNAELQSLKVGDVLKFALTSSMDSLQGRFRVTVGANVSEWMTGTISTENKKLVYYPDYIVASAGTYKFEAQVSTKP